MNISYITKNLKYAVCNVPGNGSWSVFEIVPGAPTVGWKFILNRDWFNDAITEAEKL